MTAKTIHYPRKPIVLVKSNAKTTRLPVGIQFIIALITGSGFGFSLAPYYLWPLALFSVMALYALLVSEESGRRGFWIGWIYGFGTWAVGAFWLYNSIHEYGAIPAWLAYLMIGAMALIMGLFHAFFAWGFVRFLGRQPLAFASFWVIQEWLKTWLLSGFPWLFVGYAFTEQTLINGLAPVLGVFGISFVAVLFAASVVELFRHKVTFIGLSILALLASFALGFIEWVKPTGDKLSVSLVQGNIPQDLKWLTEYRVRTLEIYENLSKNEWGQDLVIWPEAAIPMFHDEAIPFITGVIDHARKNDSTWITGLIYRNLKNYDKSHRAYPPIYNSMAVFGESQALYKKQRLVPFGEYIPFEGLFNLLPNLTNMQGAMSISRGPKNQKPFTVKGQNIGAAICYEVAYPQTTRQNAKNTNFLLTISNDAWFGSSSGPWQHLQMVQMRSLETGRYFVRATNTGVTAIINQKGKIISQIPQFERTVLRGQVQSMSGVTPFVRFGSYPILILSVLIILFSFMAKYGKTKTSRTQKYYTAKGVRD